MSNFLQSMQCYTGTILGFLYKVQLSVLIVMAITSSPLLVVTLTSFCLTHMSSIGLVLFLPSIVQRRPHFFVSSCHPPDLNQNVLFCFRMVASLLSVVKMVLDKVVFCLTVVLRALQFWMAKETGLDMVMVDLFLSWLVNLY